MNIDDYIWEIECYPFDCETACPNRCIKCDMCALAYNMIIDGTY